METYKESNLPNMSARPYIFVIGNEKGGSGKTTTAIHLMAALLAQKQAVAVLDLDLNQQSFGQFLTNRQNFCQKNQLNLMAPIILDNHLFHQIPPSDREKYQQTLYELLQNTYPQQAVQDKSKADSSQNLKACYLIIDTAGSHSTLNRTAHQIADCLITPMNDSFVDLAVLAQIDPDTLKILRPSHYAARVWEYRQERARQSRKKIDWVVLRNRLSALESRNQRDIGEILEKLAGRIGFRTAPGFGERVIYRELYAKGLTLLDIQPELQEQKLTLSQVAARQEIRGLLHEIQPQ